jgi:hypothetical protein
LSHVRLYGVDAARTRSLRGQNSVRAVSFRRSFDFACIAFALLFFSVLSLNAAEELLIPPSLNGLVPKIHAGMTIRDVKAVLSAVFPEVRSRRGLWHGETGFIDYALNDQLLLSVSSTVRRGQELVDENLLFYIVNHAQQRRLDIKSDYGNSLEREYSAAGELLIPAELNALVPRIQSGLTVREVEALFFTAYPKVKGDWGAWSGQTGYIDYRLDGQLTLSIGSASSASHGGEAVVHRDLYFAITDSARKHRLEIKSEYWIIPERK